MIPNHSWAGERQYPSHPPPPNHRNYSPSCSHISNLESYPVSLTIPLSLSVHFFAHASSRRLVLQWASAILPKTTRRQFLLDPSSHANTAAVLEVLSQPSEDTLSRSRVTSDAFPHDLQQSLCVAIYT